MRTIRVRCTCKNAFQDKTYGKQKRIANITHSGEKARCTVCGTEHNITKKNPYGDSE